MVLLITSLECPGRSFLACTDAESTESHVLSGEMHGLRSTIKRSSSDAYLSLIYAQVPFRLWSSFSLSKKGGIPHTCTRPNREKSTEPCSTYRQTSKWIPRGMKAGRGTVTRVTRKSD